MTVSQSVNSYDLRHAYATLMLTYGVNRKVAQQRLGYASICYYYGYLLTCNRQG